VTGDEREELFLTEGNEGNEEGEEARGIILTEGNEGNEGERALSALFCFWGLGEEERCFGKTVVRSGAGLAVAVHGHEVRGVVGEAGENFRLEI